MHRRGRLSPGRWRIARGTAAGPVELSLVGGVAAVDVSLLLLLAEEVRTPMQGLCGARGVEAHHLAQLGIIRDGLEADRDAANGLRVGNRPVAHRIVRLDKYFLFEGLWRRDRGLVLGGRPRRGRSLLLPLWLGLLRMRNLYLRGRVEDRRDRRIPVIDY